MHRTEGPAEVRGVAEPDRAGDRGEALVAGAQEEHRLVQPDGTGAGLDALSYALVKRQLGVTLRNDLEDQLALEAGAQSRAAASQDAREGVSAFREKRAPSFRGS